MSGPALTVRACCKSYGDRLVLRDVDLDLVAGRVTAILGRSGAGKSTLLRVVAGLERIDSGQIASAAGVLSAPGIHVPPERRRIGLVFQDYALFPHLSILQNVMFGLDGKARAAQGAKAGQAKTGRAAARARAMDLLDAVGLADRAGAHPHALSGGEQQRVALARALAPAPDIVLLDEPFSGLDARLRETTRDMALSALKQSGAAVLIVTHDAHEAMLMADALALMENGRIVQRGAPDTLYRRPVSAGAARLLGEVNEWAGAVSAGRLETPFGPLPAPGLPDGAAAMALVRPEGLILTPAAANDRPDAGPSADGHSVCERRAAGADALLRVQAPDGVQWRARLPGGAAPQAGDAVIARIDPDLATVIGC